MELAQGGSLLDYVRQRKRLAEPEACFFLQQIVHGLMHCHDMEVFPLQLSYVHSEVVLRSDMPSPPCICFALTLRHMGGPDRTQLGLPG